LNNDLPKFYLSEMTIHYLNGGEKQSNKKKEIVCSFALFSAGQRTFYFLFALK
jgi:hypothetical protein